MVRLLRANLFVCTAALLLAAPLASANVPETFSENGFISGSMNIDFGTRKNLDESGKLTEGSPAEGAKDIYTFNLNVAKTTEYAGKVERLPRLESKVLGREIQVASLKYDLAVAVRNPSNLEQKKTVGKVVGNVAIGKDGVYDFGSSTPNASQLRYAVDSVGKAQAFVGPFAGRIVGKSSGGEGLLAKKLAEVKKFTRTLKSGKTVSVAVKNSDPLKFQNLVLGKGPAENYPQTTVNGNLDYDYDTGNWYTDGITFKYTWDGKEVEDVVTGSIKWVEDPNREQNGKGAYEFNLRYNEAKNKPATDEKAAFDSGSANSEEAFFEFDDSVPAMTGTIDYVDTLEPGEEEPTVISSKVTYNLNANKLTKQQAVNFFKLWMVITGPTNDE
jgi:hypothetical protein